MHYIYRIINNINGHDYIGKKKLKESQTPLTDNYWGSGTKIKEAVRSYGIENFSKEILEDNISSESESIKREIFWIQFFKNKGMAYYNISPGAEGLDISTIEDLDEKYIQQYRDHVALKVKESWSNYSDEERRQRNQKISDAWKHKDNKFKENFSKKRSEIQKTVYSKLSKEEKESINKKRSESLKQTHQKRSPKEKDIINAKISKTVKEAQSRFSKEKKKDMAEKSSISHKEYFKKETEDHKRKRLLKQSLSLGQWYKIKDPSNNEFIIKSLSRWCKENFEKSSSARVQLSSKGKYAGFTCEKLVDIDPNINLDMMKDLKENPNSIYSTI